MREAFSSTLISLATTDRNVLLLTGDHGYSLFDEFRKVCPDQFINAGVAEQNMVGVAAGLAKSGFRPFVYGLSAFIPIRVLEQIKLDIAHDCLPVIFIGDGAGFVYSHLGTSHQSTEDIACARAIPNLQVYSPADSHEMQSCMQIAYESRRPVYLRIGKSDLGSVHSVNQIIESGQLLQIKHGKQGGISFIATGSMVRQAISVAERQFSEASVWSAPFIKPIDAQQIISICNQSEVIVTFEEHSVFGGLGSVIAEIVALHTPVRVLPIGVRDRFSEQCGDYEFLLGEHRLDVDSICHYLSLALSC